MKRYLSFLILLFAVSSLFAQRNAGANDPAAKKILDGVSAKFKSFRAVEADFSLKIEDARGKLQDERKGTVFMKGPKYRVRIGPATQSDQDIFFDGKNVFTYDRESNEATITLSDENTGGITPQKLFSNFYDKDFLYKLNGEKKEANRELQEIEMTPVDKTRAFHKLYVLIDKKAQTIYRTKVLDKGGNVYTYTVNKIENKPAIADALFVFDKKNYPGVEILDLR